MWSQAWGWLNDHCCITIDNQRSLLLHYLQKHRDAPFCKWFKEQTEQFVNAKEELTQCLYHFSQQLYRHVVTEKKCHTLFKFDESAVKQTELIRRVKSTNLKSFEFAEIDYNKVFRYYGIDKFIRVDFEDERDSTVMQTTLKGFCLYGQMFKPIGASSSLLSERGVYFTCEEDPMKMMDIFGIYASEIETKIARQCLNFTSTKETIRVHKYIVIDDINSRDGKGIVSDGIGMISYSFAKAVCCSLRDQSIDGKYVHIPRAFQIRFLGFKGMLTVCPDKIMNGNQIILRESMKKFEGNPLFNKLEIVEGLNESDTANINRQIIILLSSLQVKDEVFLNAQKKALARNKCRNDEEFRARIKNAKEKTKFFMKDSVIAKGILDETKQLKDNQVIVITKNGRMVPGGKKVIVFRNPGLHPRDVRIFETVSIPDYYQKWFGHEVDLKGSVIIFAADCQQHNIPGELGNFHLFSISNLQFKDGDRFFTSWNTEIIPQAQYIQSWWSKANEFGHTLKQFDLKKCVNTALSNFSHHLLKNYWWTSANVFEFRMSSNVSCECV
ncbi:predicted protein [Naegleria gruberi]|uniref:RNA-dependent RNA polymerase n=1 Tax=Naegleria gruberi TaxID=5762 RepID=D2VG84_NAEGR|nr:uncharacterized protein NAEGRDRAFT_67889 [Naegleria gruberi]EFC44306.1 predicted protein [Naegleria gruberi]|eukprot:XP_002677050.1 predicted protein [Naegleria gruberi strain NEG-M]